MSESAVKNTKQQVLKSIIHQYMVIDENLYDAKKLFVAATVINWVFDQKTKKETFEKYMNFVFRYLNNEIDLFWEDGTIHFKPIKK
jgi:hypothetical protein